MDRERLLIEYLWGEMDEFHSLPGSSSSILFEDNIAVIAVGKEIVAFG